MNPSERITKYIASFDDWRGQMLTQLRGLILKAEPDLTEEWTDAKAMRSIKLRKGDALNETAFQDLVRAATAHNVSGT